MTVSGLIAQKVGMTRMLADDGEMTPVTLLQVPLQKITKVLTQERDGYTGVQIGFHAKAEKHLTKPDTTRLRKSSINENFTKFREFRYDELPEGFELGSDLTVEKFTEVSALDITGITKGCGFQGATKRWGAKTGRRTHGSRFHRRPGSLGQRTTPGRVYKNKHMPGHMGHKQRTVQNLKVMDVDTKSGVIAIKGSVPGHREGYLVIRPSLKIKEKKAAKGK